MFTSPIAVKLGAARPASSRRSALGCREDAGAGFCVIDPVEDAGARTSTERSHGSRAEGFSAQDSLRIEVNQ
jgi:hypothetical protein